MNKEAIIQKTIEVLQILPPDKAEEISNYADFILKKHEETTLQLGLQQLQMESESFSFLNEEEELYSISDVKNRGSAQR